MTDGSLRLIGHTLGTTNLDLSAALDLFARSGLDGAEIIWQDGYRSGIAEGSPDQVGAAKRRADDLHLEIWCLTPYMIGLDSLDEAERQGDLARFRNCIQDAETIGARRVRVFAGEHGSASERQPPRWTRLVDSLGELSRSAEQAGVVLCVENHADTWTIGASDAARLMMDVASEAVGVLYDQANLTTSHREDYAQAIGAQGPWIRHVHVKDLASDARVGDEPQPCVVGQGTVPWREIVEQLTSIGYEGALSLEYEYRWAPNILPDPSVGIPRSAAFMRQVLAEVSRSRPTVPAPN